MEHLRTFLELAYFASGVALVFVAAYGLQQVRILKKDLAIRVERAAKEKAVEYAGRYLTHFVPLMNKYYRDQKAAKVPSYTGPIGDFSLSSVPQDYLKRTAASWITIDSGLPSLNELDHIASAFAFGVADEKTGFTIIGKTFCRSVASMYTDISRCRGDESCEYWEPIVILYRTWSARLSRSELEGLRAGIEKRLEGIGTGGIPPIGQEK